MVPDVRCDAQLHLMVPGRAPERALALPDRLPASGPAQKKRRCLQQYSPGQSFYGRGSPRRRFTGQYEQVLSRNITNLLEDWFHSRAAFHAVGIGVFGRNVDVEVKNHGVIPCIPQQIVG